MKSTLFALVCLAGLLAGCSTKAESLPAPVNTTCPMMGEPVSADGGTAEWKGQQIGFCCQRCKPRFEALSDAEKVEALAKVGVAAH